MNEGRLQNIRDAVADGTANIDDARELLAELTELRLLWEALNAERRTEAPMADRLTPKREAEIRQPRTRRLDWAPQVYEEWDDERADLLAELDAVRAERDSERDARLTCEHDLEAIPLRDRVRELEAERDAESAAWSDAYDRAERHEEHLNEIHASFGCEREWSNWHDCGACAAETAASVAHELADLAETRAQLARLREAAERVRDADTQGDEAQAIEDMASVLHALAEPGPTLASIEAAALRRAAEDVRASDLPLDTRDVRDWLHTRADELEGKR